MKAYSKQGKEVIKELEIIGKWANSCVTIEQLNGVERLFHRKIQYKSYQFPIIDSRPCYMGLGKVQGILLTLRNKL
jgi:hypothetical protein